MSHSCDTDIVPFVIHDILICEDGEISDSDLARIVDPELWAETHNEQEEDEEQEEAEVAPVRGWESVPYSEKTHVAKGKRGRLYVHSPWTKGKHEISFLNESQYSNVGEVEFCVFADTREALEAFLADFPEVQVQRQHHLKNEPLIEEKDTVSSWG